MCIFLKSLLTMFKYDSRRLGSIFSAKRRSKVLSVHANKCSETVTIILNDHIDITKDTTKDTAGSGDVPPP